MSLKARIQEALHIFNCTPSRKTEFDWTTTHAVQAGLIARPAPLPETVDLRASWWSVGDQGDTGSCVGWATCDSLLRWHFVKAKKIEKSDLLSARYLWMAAKETDDDVAMPTTFIEKVGTSIKAALDIARKFGVVLDRDLPFESGTLYRGDAQTFYARAARLKIAAYINLGADQSAWKHWLATEGPILARVTVDETWNTATATKGKLSEFRPDTATGGHAIALVGYTKDAFIVRNSWGRGWGDKGFAYASPAYAKAAITEAYGVSV
jgi:C1A family cysteine protease